MPFTKPNGERDYKRERANEKKHGDKRGKEREATTQTQWHVDHVVPIKGKDVCGLHVWYNFSVIPKIENLKKGNKTCLL